MKPDLTLLGVRVTVLWDDAEWQPELHKDAGSLPSEALCRTHGVVTRVSKKSLWVTHEEHLGPDGQVEEYVGTSRIDWVLVRRVDWFLESLYR